MKKTTFSFKNLCLASLILGGLSANAQMELKVLTDSGTRFNTVNDYGKAVTVYSYYDFATNELSDLEPGVFMAASINNDDNASGFMFYDEDESILQPAYKKDGVWTPIDFVPEQDPFDYDENFVYAMSQNSKYVTGQSNIGNNYGGFLFDTETDEMMVTFDPEGEASASYSVNDNGITAGWVDRPDAFGTLRVPAYRTLDGEYHLIPEGQLPILSGDNTIQYISNNNQMVGDFDLKPFIYDMNTDTFTSFELPEGADHAAFGSISENGIAVGYADVDWQIRDAIIYHPSLGDQPLYLKDVLMDNGIDVDTVDGLLGTAISISPNGKYIAGWLNGPPMYAEGWMVYLDDLILGTNTVPYNTISHYPNPVENILYLKAEDTIDSVVVYTITGQEVSNFKFNQEQKQVDFSNLSSGLYLVKVASNGNVENLKILKQ